MMVVAMPAMAQFNIGKAIGGGAKAVKAATLSDEQMRQYVKESIDWMDKHNKVCGPNDPYTKRLNILTFLSPPSSILFLDFFKGHKKHIPRCPRRVSRNAKQ